MLNKFASRLNEYHVVNGKSEYGFPQISCSIKFVYVRVSHNIKYDFYTVQLNDFQKYLKLGYLGYSNSITTFEVKTDDFKTLWNKVIQSVNKYNKELEKSYQVTVDNKGVFDKPIEIVDNTLQGLIKYTGMYYLCTKVESNGHTTLVSKKYPISFDFTDEKLCIVKYKSQESFGFDKYLTYDINDIDWNLIKQSVNDLLDA